MGTLRVTVRRRLSLFENENNAYLHLRSIACQEEPNQPENGIFLENEYVPEDEIRAMIHEEFTQEGYRYVVRK